MAKKGRKIPEINAGSMADISFLLLIFFLVATTMNVDSGLQRVLPPIQKDDIHFDVKKRNLMLVFVNMHDEIQAGGERVELMHLKAKAKEFILNPYNDENMPEKKVEDIDIIGQYAISEGIISLQNDRGTSYDMYIRVQNELTRAVNEIRDELSIQKFGKPFGELPEEHRKPIQTAVPMKISEAEPRNIGGV